MAFSFLYLAFRALLGALVGSRRGLDVKDLELLVLRHELGSCVARWRGRAFAPLIVPYSRRRPAICRAPCAARVWSLRGRCCGGIVHLCAGSGGSLPPSADARPCQPRYGQSCCGWHARIHAGGIGGSAVRPASSACGCRPRRSVACSPARDSTRPRGGQVRVGASSCAPRRPASSLAISSPWRACSCAGITCCSSLRMQADECGSLAVRPIPPARGSPSRRAISAWTWRTRARGF
jgi:hypothetical protein